MGPEQELMIINENRGSPRHREVVAFKLPLHQSGGYIPKLRFEGNFKELELTDSCKPVPERPHLSLEIRGTSVHHKPIWKRSSTFSEKLPRALR